MLSLIKLWTDDEQIRKWMNDVLEIYENIMSDIPDWEENNKEELKIINWGGSSQLKIPSNWPLEEDIWVFSSPVLINPQSMKIPLFLNIYRSAAALLAINYNWFVTDIKQNNSASILDLSETDTSKEIKPTNQERKILQLLASGEPNKSIAMQLSISESTVKFHINSLFNKLKTQNRTETVYEAIRRGWIIL